MAAFHLTRRALRDLQAIHTHSVAQWGVRVADDYLQALYAVFEEIANNPALGTPRKGRSHPFLMVPARRHFVVYDRLPQGVVILTLLHQVRDIEGIVQSLGPAFSAEIAALKNRRPRK